MTIQERHNEVNKLIAKLKVLHEKFFPPARALNDEEWQQFIDGVWGVANEYKGTNLENLAGDLAMVFSNDIERMHKAWIRRGNEIQEAKQE